MDTSTASTNPASTTDVIRLRRSKIYDVVFLLVVVAIVLLVVIPAFVPLVQAYKGSCRTTVTTPAPVPIAQGAK